MNHDRFACDRRPACHTLFRHILVLMGMTSIGFFSTVARAGDTDGKWGTIKGQVVWGGKELPVPKPITVTQDQTHCLSKGPLLEEDWVVNKDNKGIRWAFAWLVPNDPTGPKLSIHPSLKEITVKDVIVDQPCCQFRPRAVGIRQGQDLIARNSAPITHNINWTGGFKNAGGNVILAPGGEKIINGLVADKTPVKLACNLHSWMNGWVRIFDHPYFAVTDENGNFEMKLVPAGKCRLVIWQESVGYLGGAAGKNGKPITVQAGTVTDLGKFALAPD